MFFNKKSVPSLFTYVQKFSYLPLGLFFPLRKEIGTSGIVKRRVMFLEEHLKELWVPLSGAIAQQRKVETIANNVANANTTGFKRDELSFKEYLTTHEKGADIDLPNKEWAPKDFYKSYGAENAMVEVNASYTDFTQGQIKPTNNPLDIAINGPGFIEVLAPNGIRYTRNGALSINNNGELTTKDGFLVLSKNLSNENSDTKELGVKVNPNDRAIKLIDAPIIINNKGAIFQNSQQ